MALSDQQIRQITDEIIKELAGRVKVETGTGQATIARSGTQTNSSVSPSGNWLCDSIDEAVINAARSQVELNAITLEKRADIINAMRMAAIENAGALAELAHKETGYGRVSDKIKKNILAARKTPGIEDLDTKAFTGDNGMTIVELTPFGVIGSITPSTNPTSTVINNSISMIASGNAVVFNPHPSAKKASQETIRLMNQAIVSAGGPGSLITTVKEPSIETGNALMNHPDIPLLSITGGEAVVKAAMKTGKKVIAAGPGNPPVIVDDTANIKNAAMDIFKGASFDNNILCIAEKEVFAFSNIADQLMSEMVGLGCYQADKAAIDRIVNTVLIKKENGYVINRKFVGKDPSVILQASGIEFSGEPRLILAEVSSDHPFVRVEMLMPVLPIVRVNDIKQAVEEAYIAEQQNKHSAMIHSTNVHNMSLAAKRLNTTIFVKNASSLGGLGFGGEGFTSLTIATPTGEGITSARTFTRQRRCVLHGDFRIF